jgi:hypothetical protein
VIRNTVIHITNEQPLLADLYAMPTSADVSLVCTNVRMLDGKKPIFVDRSDSVFVFPYNLVRFIEILAAAAEGLSDDPETTLAAPDPEPPADEIDDTELELDEDFLRRIREA